jgi:hypothetical protein
MKITCFFLILFFITSSTSQADISIEEILTDFLELNTNKEKVEVLNDLEKTIKSQNLFLIFSNELNLCKDSLHSSNEIRDYINSLKFSLDSIKDSQASIERKLEDYSQKIKKEENDLLILADNRKIEEDKNSKNLKNLDSEIEIVKHCLSILETNRNGNNFEFIQLSTDTSNSLKSKLKSLTETTNNLEEINLVLLQTYITANEGENSVSYLEKIYKLLTNLYSDLSKKLIAVKNNFDIIYKDYLKIESSKQESIKDIKNIISIHEEKLLNQKKEIHLLETSVQKLNLLKFDEVYNDPCQSFINFMDGEMQDAEKARQVVSKFILYNNTD